MTVIALCAPPEPHVLPLPLASMSLIRQIQNIRKAGFKQYWRDLQYIGTAKAGTLVGVDRCVVPRWPHHVMRGGC